MRVAFTALSLDTILISATLLAQTTEAPITITGVTNAMSMLASYGLATWLVIHMTTIVQPRWEKKTGEERAELIKLHREERDLLETRHNTAWLQQEARHREERLEWQKGHISITSMFATELAEHRKMRDETLTRFYVALEAVNESTQENTRLMAVVERLLSEHQKLEHGR